MYRQFEALLWRELKQPKVYLRPLLPYFREHSWHGLDYREFPRPFLDTYLLPMPVDKRRVFLNALTRWLKFLQGRRVTLIPARPELPGGPVHCPKRREKKLSLLPPVEWPNQARRLYQEFVERSKQKVKLPRQRLRPLYHFFPWQLAQGLTFRDFPPAALEAYLATLNGPHARVHFLTSLMGWLKFLYARKELLLPLHEALGDYRVRPPARRVLLSQAQVMEVLALPPLDDPEGLRDRAMLEVAYASGIRRGELTALNLTDLDLAAGLLNILQAKNSCQRNVPLTRWALHYLRRYLEVARPQLLSPLSLNALWLSRTGQRLDVDGLRKRLKNIYCARQKLGFRFTLHQLRHACATHLLEAGASLRAVQELLGHLNFTSTQTYTHITPTRLRQVHQRCHPRNNGQFPPGDWPDFKN